LTTTVTLVRSKSAERLWKLAACVSICLRTFSIVQLVCWDAEARIVERSEAAATAAHNNTQILKTVLDTLMKPAPSDPPSPVNCFLPMPKERFRFVKQSYHTGLDAKSSSGDTPSGKELRKMPASPVAPALNLFV
jgi:hypothetical protein